jgi:hypothetical protein
MNIFEELTEHLAVSHRESPERKMLMEDPVKFFAESYNALIADLDPGKIEAGDMSRDFVIAKVLENEAKHLLEATTTTGEISTFTTVAMPLVRKIFNRLIAMDLVSVQPIDQPTAKIFYLDFKYHDAPAGGSAGDSVADIRDKDYSTSAETGAVKEIDMEITDETVTAIEKKLKAKWTVELEQDLQAYHKLSAETELTKVLQDQIVREIDGLIIACLLAGATGTGTGLGTGAGNVNWNINGYLAGDTTTTYRKDYRKTIYEAIIDASNLIFKKRFNYATWIIGHPDAVVRLEKLEEFKTSENGQPGEYTIGRHLVGTLNDRFKVYKDPFFPVANKLLMGYKGENWTDAVGFYSPYIPLYVTPKIIDADDFIPRKGLMSRFAYGTLIKDGLATVTLTTS